LTCAFTPAHDASQEDEVLRMTGAWSK